MFNESRIHSPELRQMCMFTLGIHSPNYSESILYTRTFLSHWFLAFHLAKLKWEWEQKIHRFFFSSENASKWIHQNILHDFETLLFDCMYMLYCIAHSICHTRIIFCVCVCVWITFAMAMQILFKIVRDAKMMEDEVEIEISKLCSNIQSLAI